MTLSLVMVTYNSVDVVEGALKSIAGVWDELLVGDGGSTDGTMEMVKKYGGTVVAQKKNVPLGMRKQELVDRAKGQWILVLDADERVSEELYWKIRRIIRGSSTALGTAIAAYRIQYQNYVFGRPVYYGGEKYAKVRLFRRGYARISPEPIHEEVIVAEKFHKATPSKKLRGGLEDGNIGYLNGVIHHHSYRTPWQLLTKFTRYAWIAAREKKRQGETLTLKKLFLYAPHMFWTRYIKEQGYKDGWRGLILAVAFGYMEGLTFWFLLFRALIIL